MKKFVFFDVFTLDRSTRDTHDRVYTLYSCIHCTCVEPFCRFSDEVSTDQKGNDDETFHPWQNNTVVLSIINTYTIKIHKKF